jgi:hypothetical protein
MAKRNTATKFFLSNPDHPDQGQTTKQINLIHNATNPDRQWSNPDQ